MQRTKFLVISDLHIKQDYKTDILDDFMDTALKLHPDCLVLTGDFGDFDSKAHYLKDRNGLQPAEEVAQVLSVLDKHLFDRLKDYQDQQRKKKVKLYRPDILCCMGNHDERVDDLLYPELKKRCTQVVHNREHIQYGGVYFAHTFDKGITGTHCRDAQDVLLNTMVCSVSGHSHARDIHEVKTPDGLPVFAIKMPCATDSYPDWAGHKGMAWSRGFLCLTTSCLLGRVVQYAYTFFGD